MALSLLKLISILTLLTALLLPFVSPNPIFSDSEDDEEQDYILDNPPTSTSLRHKLLAKIKKGTQCSTTHYNVCNGVSADKGKSILYCCKKHCRNVLSDRNNCGKCGHKCGIFQRCCGGKCTNVANNPSNCGKCNKKCKPGVKCDWGYCGYA